MTICLGRFAGLMAGSISYAWFVFSSRTRNVCAFGHIIAHSLACLLVGRKMWLKVAHLFATARAGIPNSVMTHPWANRMANSGKNNLILASEEGQGLI